MKAFKGRKLLCSNVRDCKGFMSAIGLRFKSNFGKYDGYLIHILPDSILDSYFVFMNFVAVWLDKRNRVIKIKLCKRNKLFPPIKGQHLVLELPEGKKHGLKVGDKVTFK